MLQHRNCGCQLFVVLVALVGVAALAPRPRHVQLPPPTPLRDVAAFDGAHHFSATANWILPGHVLAGSYPGGCPLRPPTRDGQWPRAALRALLDAGISTFVCLQEELPPQDDLWPAEGIPRSDSENPRRAAWANGNFQNYRQHVDHLLELEAQQTAGSASALVAPTRAVAVDYLHYKLPDFSIASSLEELDEIVTHLARLVKDGDKLYIHCWGGRGRTGLMSACVLGALYGDMDAEEALERVQRAYDLREPWKKGTTLERSSPETDAQRNQARDWFAYKRTFLTALAAPRKNAETYGIWDEAKTEMLEAISHSASHPLTLAAARRRERDAGRLGRGRFGTVFRGRAEHLPTKPPVAIKVTYYLEDIPNHLQSKLALEAEVLQKVSGKIGFPRVFFSTRTTVFGRHSDVLVMEMLGKPLLNRMWAKEEGDALCEKESKSFTEAAVLSIGGDLIECLRGLHTAGFCHNDLKPTNIVFGAPGSTAEDKAHLVDFGMVTSPGLCQDGTVEGCELQAGGASPIFANLSQLQGRPTRPVDDVESLWYCLAYLVEKQLPWQWEPTENLRNIKRQLFIDECGINSDECTANVKAEECCSTRHCFDTCDEWDVPQALHDLWGYVLEGQEDGSVDYDGCLRALAEGMEV